MKHACLFLVMLLLFSCSTEQLSPRAVKDPNINSLKSPGAGGSTNSLLATECYICSDAFRTNPSLPCGGTFSGSYNTPGSTHFYPSVYADISPNSTSINVQLKALDVPNYYTLTYQDKNGATVATWTSGWIGHLNYIGPWFGTIPRDEPQGSPGVKSAPAYNTGAQTTAWPCPFVLPGTSPVVEYRNSTMQQPVSGVTWSISPTPSGSASLVGNGSVNQTINVSASATSFYLLATTNDLVQPSPNGFLNCNTDVTIGIPVLSNIAKLKIDVWTVTPSVASGINPNTDSWDVIVTCTQNNSASSCDECY